jgi:hypothetical protein
MAGTLGQAAGLAVGAAVGSMAGNPIGGAALGLSVGGSIGSIGANKQQAKLEREAIRLNKEQYHAQAAARSAIHAANFRQSLAHQVSLASMRGGSGSIASQFGAQAYKNFLDDQKAIELGVAASDVQSSLSEADTTARQQAGNVQAAGRIISAFDAINLNMPRQSKG